MALCCQYLSLTIISVFILRTNSLQYGDFEGHEYIILDHSSSNTADFYSSLFDSQGNVDSSKLTKQFKRERRDAQPHGDEDRNVTKLGSATEYEFHGDNHTVAFLHWLKTQSQVIFTSQFLYRKSSGLHNLAHYDRLNCLLIFIIISILCALYLT